MNRFRRVKQDGPIDSLTEARAIAIRAQIAFDHLHAIGDASGATSSLCPCMIKAANLQIGLRFGQRWNVGQPFHERLDEAPPEPAERSGHQHCACVHGHMPLLSLEEGECIAPRQCHDRALRVDARGGTQEACVGDIEIVVAMDAAERIGGAPASILSHRTRGEEVHRHQVGPLAVEYVRQPPQIVGRRQGRASRSARVKRRGAGGEQDFGKTTKRLRQLLQVPLRDPIPDDRIVVAGQASDRTSTRC